MAQDEDVHVHVGLLDIKLLIFELQEIKRMVSMLILHTYHFNTLKETVFFY